MYFKNKKHHYYFVIFLIAIINFIVGDIILLYITGALFVIVVTGLPIIFLNLGLKTSGALRKNCFFVAIGIILSACGVAFDIPEARVYWIGIPGFLEVIKFVAPMLQIGGCIFLGIGFRGFK